MGVSEQIIYRLLPIVHIFVSHTFSLIFPPFSLKKNIPNRDKGSEDYFFLLLFCEKTTEKLRVNLK